MKHTTFKIPYDLARHILRERKFSQFRVWIAAKGLHGAFCNKKELDRKGIARLCGFDSLQSVDYHLSKLLEWNWIGQDDTNYYFRPIKFLKQQYDISDNARGYELELEKELTDLQAVLFFMAVKRVISFRQFAVANNGAYQQADANGYTLQYYSARHISVRLLSKLLGISVSMVHRLKKYAYKLKYIKIKHNSRLVLPYEHAYLSHYHRGSLFTKDKAVRVRLTDKITPFV